MESHYTGETPVAAIFSSSASSSISSGLHDSASRPPVCRVVGNRLVVWLKAAALGALGAPSQTLDGHNVVVPFERYGLRDSATGCRGARSRAMNRREIHGMTLAHGSLLHEDRILLRRGRARSTRRTAGARAQRDMTRRTRLRSASSRRRDRGIRTDRGTTRRAHRGAKRTELISLVNLLVFLPQKIDGGEGAARYAPQGRNHDQKTRTSHRAPRAPAKGAMWREPRKSLDRLAHPLLQGQGLSPPLPERLRKSAEARSWPRCGATAARGLGQK
jgi:hypothetical protein